RRNVHSSYTHFSLHLLRHTHLDLLLYACSGHIALHCPMPFFHSYACFCLLLIISLHFFFFFFSSRRRHTRLVSDWSSDVCSSDLAQYKLGYCYYKQMRAPDRDQTETKNAIREFETF